MLSFSKIGILQIFYVLMLRLLVFFTMSIISRLPESTTRLLGAPLTIATPVTLVKELLDNSIDAKATSIEVLISTDTVKKIEIRDNGLGIHPNDYDALGRRGHTSKLRSFEDLRNRCGKSLGFRGEALASANSLAQVTITTKIASEPVAAILHIAPGTGGVLKQQPTSAPVGTTVSITGLFGQLPVREQIAIKDSAKTIEKIRELLRCYAMARPQLRYSLKVLQLPKQNWTYSPKPDCSVKEAAVQLFGAEINTNCFEKIFKINGLTSDNSPTRKQDTPLDCHYVFEAFIIKPSSDLSKIPKQRYFSVDGRPVTTKRGTMKKLLNIYVEHVSLAHQRNSTASTPNYCFIRLNLKCPSGSYDVNIEPSKDDILFSDEKLVLDSFASMCRDVYKVSTPSEPNQQSVRNTSTLHKDGLVVREALSLKPRIELHSKGADGYSPPSKAEDKPIPQSTLEAYTPRQRPFIPQKPSRGLQGTGQRMNNPTGTKFTPINAQPQDTPNKSASKEALCQGSIMPGLIPTRCKIDMSTDLNEYCHDHPRKKFPRSTDAFPSLQEKTDTVKCLAPGDVNPWVIAKMNASYRGIEERVEEEPVYQGGSPLSVYEIPVSPDPPILRQTGAAPRDLDVPPSKQYMELRGNLRPLRPGAPGGPYRSPVSSPCGTASQKVLSNPTIPTALKSRRRRNYPPWSPPSSIERTIPSKDHSVNAGHGPIPDGMKQTTISFGDVKRKHGRRLQEDSNACNRQNLRDQEPHEEGSPQRELVPRRRKSVNELSREKELRSPQQRQNQTNVLTKLSPGCSYAKSYTIHTKDKGSPSKVKEPIQTTLPSGDPRAYLLRRQKSMAAEETKVNPRKLRRLKSSLLPLENIPSDDQTHLLVLVQVLNTEVLRISMRQAVKYDEYAANRTAGNGLDMNLDEGRRVEQRLKSILHGWKGATGIEDSEPEINVCSLLKGKGTTTGS